MATNSSRLVRNATLSDAIDSMCVWQLFVDNKINHFVTLRVKLTRSPLVEK